MKHAIGLLLVAPLAAFAAQAFFGEGGFAFHAGAWLNTLEIASLTTAIALLFGLPSACVLAHHPRGSWIALTLVPLLLPPALPAAAWLVTGLPAPGVVSCGIVLGAVTWPVVALLVWASLTRLPRTQLEAADLQLGGRRALLLVTWPHVRPSVFAAASIVFLLAASEFTVPATFALPTISAMIFQDVSAFRFASAAWTSLPLVVLAIGVAAPLRRVLVLPQIGPTRAFLKKAPLAAAGAISVMAWGATAAFPAILFLITVGSPAAFAGALWLYAEAFAWSAGVGLATALLLVAWASTAPRRSALEPLWLAGLCLPGIIPALGALALSNRLGVQPFLAPMGVLLVWALMARFAYVAWLPLREPVERGQLEAAALGGLPKGRTWRKIVLPALLPKALVVGAVVFALSLGEVGPSVLLAPPGGQTAVQHLFNLMHYGYDETVASLALALTSGAALLAGLGAYVGRCGRAAIGV